MDELLKRLSLRWSIDLLIKEEVEFEIKRLGGKPMGTVHNLRKQYRQLVSDKADEIQFVFDGDSFDDEITLLIDKISTVKAFLSDPEVFKDDSKLKKVETKIAHLIHRYVQCHNSIYLANTTDRIDYETMEKQFEHLLTQFLEESSNITSKTLLDSQLGKVPISTPSPICTTSVQTPCDTNPRLEFSTGNGTAVNKLVTQYEQTHLNGNKNITRPSYLPIPNTPINIVSSAPNLISTVGQSANYDPPQQNIFLDSYAKLANPIQSYLQQLKICDGLDANELLNFIKITLKIRKLRQLSDYSLFQVLMPYMEGLIKERAQNYMISGISFDQFHEDILKICIPQRLMVKLEQEMFYRLQRSGEPLQSFIISIKENAQVLRLQRQESEIVDTIIEGLNPVERQRFIFAQRPKNFFDLDSLCIQSQNVRYSDIQRVHDERNPAKNYSVNQNENRRFNCAPQMSQNFNKSNFQGKIQNPAMQFSPRNQVPNPNFNNNRMNVSSINSPIEFRCYHCNKPGHLARNCFIKNKYQSKNDSSVTTNPNR
jgi:hypothetical protein